MRPELEGATQEMACVTRAACIEVAEMPRPPQAVKDTVAVVMMAFPPPTMRQHSAKKGTHWNKAPTEWARAEAFLRDPGVLKRFDEYDRDRLPRQRAMMMQEKIASFGYEFRSENIAVKSVAAAQLCQWVNGLLHYCHVLFQMQDFDLWTSDTERRLEAAEHRLREVTELGRATAAARSPARAQSPGRASSPRGARAGSPRRASVRLALPAGVRADAYSQLAPDQAPVDVRLGDLLDSDAKGLIQW